MRPLAIVVVLGACAGDPDLAGHYVVDADYEGLGCDVPATLNAYPVMSIDVTPAGVMTMSYENSTGMPITLASGDDSWFGSFARTIPNGEAPSHCSLGYEMYDVTLDGQGLVVDWRRYSFTAETTEQCTVEEATRRGMAATSCSQRERIEATKL